MPFSNVSVMSKVMKAPKNPNDDAKEMIVGYQHLQTVIALNQTPVSKFHNERTAKISEMQLVVNERKRVRKQETSLPVLTIMGVNRKGVQRKRTLVQKGMLHLQSGKIFQAFLECNLF